MLEIFTTPVINGTLVHIDSIASVKFQSVDRTIFDKVTDLHYTEDSSPSPAIGRIEQH